MAGEKKHNLTEAGDNHLYLECGWFLCVCARVGANKLICPSVCAWICVYVCRPQYNPLYHCCPWQVKKWILSAFAAFGTTIIPLSQPHCINVNHTRLLSDEHNVVHHLWARNLMQLCCVWSSVQIRACLFIKQFRLGKIRRKVLLIWRGIVISLKAT